MIVLVETFNNLLLVYTLFPSDVRLLQESVDRTFDGSEGFLCDRCERKNVAARIMARATADEALLIREPFALPPDGDRMAG